MSEQNSTRFIEAKNGPTVTKGKGTEKGVQGALPLADIMYGEVPRGRQYSTESSSSDSIASCYADGQ